MKNEMEMVVVAVPCPACGFGSIGVEFCHSPASVRACCDGCGFSGPSVQRSRMVEAVNGQPVIHKIDKSMAFEAWNQAYDPEHEPLIDDDFDCCCCGDVFDDGSGVIGFVFWAIILVIGFGILWAIAGGLGK